MNKIEKPVIEKGELTPELLAALDIVAGYMHSKGYISINIGEYNEYNKTYNSLSFGTDNDLIEAEKRAREEVLKDVYLLVGSQAETRQVWAIKEKMKLYASTHDISLPDQP